MVATAFPKTVAATSEDQTWKTPKTSAMTTSDTIVEMTDTIE